MERNITLLILALLTWLASGCGENVVSGGEYILRSGETLDEDLVITSGRATLEAGSRVTGDVVMLSGELEVDGEIDGDLVVTSGRADLGATAVVRGDIVNASGTINQAEGAQVAGTVVPNASRFIAGLIFTTCLLPVLLLGVVIVGLLFFFVGHRRRRAGAPHAQTPAALTDQGQGLADASHLPAEPKRPATTVALDRYEILEEIGRGGFAIVYRARDTKLDRLVALKELRSLLLSDAGWVKRFQREARTIARLDHPRIVPLYDVYETQERLFIVMRLVDGPGLDQLIAARNRLPWPEALEIITAIAEGLDYAHTKGVLHRDLKPANILLDSERGPLLSDFGLAKLVGEHSISSSGDIVGTPHYIAPEVWEGQPVTAQSDIYALSCILYEMLTGDKVFKGETPPQVMLAHFSPLALPQGWPEGVPDGLGVVLKSALARKPADRFASAAEMAQALAALT